MISNLSNERGYCWASNKYLAECLNCSESTLRQHISDLENAKILVRVIKLDDKGQVELRTLSILTEYLLPPAEKSAPPPAEKSAHNKYIINTDSINSKVDAFLKLFNDTTDRHFKTLEHSDVRNFKKLIDRGYRFPDFRKAISIAHFEMTERKTVKYLTPEFILRPKEFEKYVNMVEIVDMMPQPSHPPLMAEN